MVYKYANHRTGCARKRGDGGHQASTEISLVSWEVL